MVAYFPGLAPPSEPEETESYSTPGGLNFQRLWRDYGKLLGGSRGGLYTSGDDGPDYAALTDVPGAPVPPPPQRPPVPNPLEDVLAIPSYGEDAAEQYMREQQEAAEQRFAPRGQASVTIGGKTYDYGAGERIPLLHRGGYGGGNLAAMQPGGIVPGREPSQISPVGLAEEEQRGGTGVSTMQTADILPSQLQQARRKAALSGLEARAADPYGVRQFEARAGIEERLRAAAARAKGEEDRRTQEATRGGFGSEMNGALSRYEAALARLQAHKKAGLNQTEYQETLDRLNWQLEFDKQTIGGKYGVRMPEAIG